MRTYYFAAENKDAMIQWMNAMSLASIGEQEKDLSKGRLGSVSSAGGISLKGDSLEICTYHISLNNVRGH